MFKRFQTRKRFYVTHDADDDGWSVVDCIDSTLLTFSTFRAASAAAIFARAYVKQHGDIDFNSFPYAWDQPLCYDKNTKRDWSTTDEID